MNIQIETFLPWDAGKIITTKRGPRLLRKAEPTPDAVRMWQGNKAWFVANGVEYAKAYKDETKFEFVWWCTPQELAAKREEALAQSHALDAEVDIPIPPGLSYRPYQKAGVRFGLGRKGVLFGDEPGLGKTWQAIGLINSQPTMNLGLIICPTSVKLNWYRELKRLLVRPLSVWIAEPHIYPKADIVIINYHLVRKWERFLRKNFDFVIIDEAHNLRNGSKTQMGKVIFGYKPSKKLGDTPIPAIIGRQRMALTGSPVVNKAEDVYPVANWLDPITYPSEWHFKWKWCGGDGTQPNYKYLQEHLRSTIMIRRLAKDVLTELPPITREVVEFDHDCAEVAKERAAWTEGEEERSNLEAAMEIAKVMGNKSAFDAYSKELSANITFKFKEMAELRMATAKAKLPMCIEMLEDIIAQGQKVITFAHHRFVIEAVAKAIPGSVIHYGGMSEAEKQISIDRFQEDDRCKLFSGSLGASREGITLTAARHTMFIESDWRPAFMSQSEKRMHRIGQMFAAIATHTVLKNSIDVNIVRALITKQEIADRCLDDEDRAAAMAEAAASDRITIGAREYQEAANSITDDQARQILFCVQHIASNAKENNAGFNATDAKLGTWLAGHTVLNKRQALLGLRIAQRYAKQIPSQLLAAAEGK
jgi:SWI/SNF-related matrix-associated actin-dependent regulator 1 of chromatin subfamily A